MSIHMETKLTIIFQREAKVKKTAKLSIVATRLKKIKINKTILNANSVVIGNLRVFVTKWKLKYLKSLSKAI